MSSNFEWQKRQTNERVDARLREGNVHRHVKEGRGHFLPMMAARRQRRAERLERARQQLRENVAANRKREPEPKREESWLTRLAWHRKA